MKLTDATTKITFKNILFTTDFSPVSERALLYAESIARRYGSTLVAAHVISPLETRMVPPEAWGASQQALDDAANLEMDALDARLKGFPHEVVVRHGLVWDTISELIEQKDVDLLVMGTHGRSGLGRFLMGSVAEEVFRQATCPVLTIGPRVLAEAPPEAEFKHIILATDFNPESLAAPFAISLAQEYQAQLTLLNVAPLAEPLGADPVRVVEARTKQLHALVPPDAELWCSPEYTVRFGVPAANILEVAAEKHADLIVLGARSAAGHVGAATHAVAATAHSVVASAACPVLTVREAGGESRGRTT